MICVAVVCVRVGLLCVVYVCFVRVLCFVCFIVVVRFVFLYIYCVFVLWRGLLLCRL